MLNSQCVFEFKNENIKWIKVKHIRKIKYWIKNQHITSEQDCKNVNLKKEDIHIYVTFYLNIWVSLFSVDIFSIF